MDSCYRNNPQHKIDFSHPTDSDWKMGDCPYGTRCYRRNKIHKSRFSHTKRQAAVTARHNMVSFNDAMRGSGSESEEFESSDEFEEDQSEIMSSDEVNNSDVGMD